MHIKPLNSVADSTLPETVVPHMLNQAHVIFARRSKRLSVPLRLINKPLSLDSYAASLSLFLSHHSLLTVERWSELENAPPPVTS